MLIKPPPHLNRIGDDSIVRETIETLHIKAQPELGERESITNVEATILDYSVGVLGSETYPSSYSRVKVPVSKEFPCLSIRTQMAKRKCEIGLS